jgi:tRNA-splicing ligase RtcB (3'-phosphate/5'-hydroxy nucleic acid ligase)
MIHSGSRNFGLKTAEHCNRLASLNEKRHADVPKAWYLAFLPLDTGEGQAYLREMRYCVDFAHNYAAMENHFGRDVLVHRKGATPAHKGQTGMIPGSQGTKSYIVAGKGNPQSFESCSHGAGRKLSRAKARETLNLKEGIRRLEEQGILHAIRGRKDLDEAPGAYKDIDEVMANQADLVEVMVELTPLSVIKG